MISSPAFAIPTPLGNVLKAPLSPSMKGRVERIRVRLAEALSRVQVRGFDLQIYQDAPMIAGRPGKLAVSADRISEWEFRCQDGRIRATRKGQDGLAEKTVDLREPVSVRAPGGFLNFQARPYRENLMIYSVGSFCEVVNVVNVEKYLDGLVNAEFNSKWNQEAIAAQVVAARTYAYYQMLRAHRNPNSHFDVDSTDRDQVYDGSIREDLRASRAVAKSRGWILASAAVDRGIIPLKAFYHSSCGGMTELPEYVWGGPFPGFKRAVQCPFCAGAPASEWESELSNSEIVASFTRILKNAVRPFGWPANSLEVVRKGKLMDLRVTGLDPQGRVGEVSLSFALHSPTGMRLVELPMAGSRFRDWIGAAKLKSTQFRVVARRGVLGGVRWHFQGRGNGHGVGMCQWGAKVMGDRGYTMASILKHYYPDAVLRKLW